MVEKLYKGMQKGISNEAMQNYMKNTKCPQPSFYTPDKMTADWYRDNYFEEGKGKTYNLCTGKKNKKLLDLSDKATVERVMNEKNIKSNRKLINDLKFMTGYGYSEAEQARVHKRLVKEFGVTEYPLRKIITKLKKNDRNTLKRASIAEVDDRALKALCSKMNIDGFKFKKMPTLFGKTFYPIWHEEVAFCCPYKMNIKMCED